MIDLKAPPFELTGVQCRWVEDTLASMTEREKAGQLFCVMGGDYPLEELKRMAGEGLVGGVLYAVKWPGRNNPRFGCHEIFHVFILLGSMCHFWLIYQVAAAL